MVHSIIEKIETISTCIEKFYNLYSYLLLP